MSSLITVLGFSFIAWMLFTCCQQERGQVRLDWLSILILFNLLGAVAYFLVRWIPQSQLFGSSPIKQRQLQEDLRYAIAEVRNIGNAHQYVKLGHVHLKMGSCDHALAAYQRALKKDPNEVEALWGSAVIEVRNKNLEHSAVLLQKLMKVRPDFKFGEASLMYGQVLFNMGDFNLADQHLQAHLQQWSHPEAILLIAQTQTHQQNTSKACEMLEKMIVDIEGAPAFHHRGISNKLFKLNVY